MSEILDFDPDALREKYRHERDRRLRPEANDQYVEITADFGHYIDDPHVDPGFTRKPLTDAVDVVIVGGGFGGLLAAAVASSPTTGPRACARCMAFTVMASRTASTWALPKIPLRRTSRTCWTNRRATSPTS